MGNRVLVVFHNHDTVSPTVYLHWCNDQVPELIEKLKTVMIGRENDAQYAAARFVGICHVEFPGNMSLGIINNKYTLASIKNAKKMADESHGNAGIVIVDTKDFTWKAYGGYLADYHDKVDTEDDR